MAKATWKKTILAGTPCLVPYCRDAEDWLRKTSLDQGVLIDPRRPRNIRHHRKFFALVKLAVDNWPVDITINALVGLIKIRTGHADPVKGADSVIHWIPRSINFESMDQDEFEPFYEKAVQLIALALGVDAETLDNEASKNN